jgi:hypothetical protein
MLDQSEAHRRRLLIAGAAGLSTDEEAITQIPSAEAETDDMTDHSIIPGEEYMAQTAKAAMNMPPIK